MKDENRLNMIEEKKPSAFKRTLVILLVTALLLSAGVYGALFVLFQGPFIHAQAAFVQDVGAHPIGSALVDLFVSPETRTELMSIDSGTGIADGHQKTFSVHPQLG